MTRDVLYYQKTMKENKLLEQKIEIIRDIETLETLVDNCTTNWDQVLFCALKSGNLDIVNWIAEREPMTRVLNQTCRAGHVEMFDQTIQRFRRWAFHNSSYKKILTKLYLMLV